MSVEHGGQGIGPSLPIHLPGNVLSRKAILHNAHVPAQSPFQKRLRNVKMAAYTIYW
jgi:hypothetical protein